MPSFEWWPNNRNNFIIDDDCGFAASDAAVDVLRSHFHFVYALALTSERRWQQGNFLMRGIQVVYIKSTRALSRYVMRLRCAANSNNFCLMCASAPFTLMRAKSEIIKNHQLEKYYFKKHQKKFIMLIYFFFKLVYVNTNMYRLIFFLLCHTRALILYSHMR